MSRQPILIVDDDPQVGKLLARTLKRVGFEVSVTEDAVTALDLLDHASYGVVVSDILMPAMTGIDFVRELRRRHLDVPVVFVTGTPSLETAVDAIECGAVRYLTKPIDMARFTDAVIQAEAVSRLARAKRTALELHGEHDGLFGDDASIEPRFTAALENMYLAFQPIVSHRAGAIVAFEALLRTDEPSLQVPSAFVAAAERLGRLEDLGRRVRELTALAMPDVPAGIDVFVNVHATDIEDSNLSDPDAPLSPYASRIVLELTERASLDHVRDAKHRLAAIRSLGYRIAIDDLGAGYSGLNWLATFQPDIVKIDMGLVRHVDTDPTRQRVIRSLLDLCRQLDVRVVVEGVETIGERDAIVSLGGDVMQGYHYAKPCRELGGISCSHEPTVRPNAS